MHCNSNGIFFFFLCVFLGTTWMQEILPPLLNGGDLTSVETIPNWDRAPWLEETRASVVLDKLPSPRAIVSHMQYNLMPSSFFKSKAKVQKIKELSYKYIVCIANVLLLTYYRERNNTFFCIH